MGCGANDIISPRATGRGRWCTMCHDAALKRTLIYLFVLTTHTTSEFHARILIVHCGAGAGTTNMQPRGGPARLSRAIERALSNELVATLAHLKNAFRPILSRLTSCWGSKRFDEEVVLPDPGLY